MKPELIHILDQSVCLSRRQMKDYLAGTMLNIEQHAVEVHLSACPLCRMAIDGLEEHSEEALAAIASLNSGFLKEHYDAVTPQIHLNSVAPSIAAVSRHRAKHRSQPLGWKHMGIAATILLAFGTIWYLQIGRDSVRSATSSGLLADKAETSEPQHYGSTSSPVSAAPLVTTDQGSNKNTPPQKPVSSAAVPVADQKSTGYVATSNSHVTGAVSGDTITPVAVVAVKSAEQVDKLVNQQTADVVALGTSVHQAKQSDLTIGGGRSSGNAYVVDGVQYPSPLLNNASNTPPSNRYFRNNTAFKPLKSKGEAKSQRASEDAMEKGDALADNGNFKAAATQYKKEMNDEEGSRAHRHQAGILAAKAYINAGQKAKAIAVLQKIIDEGGAQKRVAKRMLRDLQR